MSGAVAASGYICIPGRRWADDWTTHLRTDLQRVMTHYLSKFMDRSLTAWPSLSKAAAILGRNVRSLRRVMRQLETLGVVRRVDDPRDIRDPDTFERLAKVRNLRTSVLVGLPAPPETGAQASLDFRPSRTGESVPPGPGSPGGGRTRESYHQSQGLTHPVEASPVRHCDENSTTLSGVRPRTYTREEPDMASAAASAPLAPDLSPGFFEDAPAQDVDWWLGLDVEAAEREARREREREDGGGDDPWPPHPGEDPDLSDPPLDLTGNGTRTPDFAADRPESIAPPKTESIFSGEGRAPAPTPAPSSSRPRGVTSTVEAKPDPLPPELMVKIWNGAMRGTTIPLIFDISSGRRRRLRAVARQACRNNPYCWEDVCREIARTPFYQGGGGSPAFIGWRADIEYMLTGDRVLLIVERLLSAVGVGSSEGRPQDTRPTSPVSSPVSGPADPVVLPEPSLSRDELFARFPAEIMKPLLGAVDPDPETEKSNVLGAIALLVAFGSLEEDHMPRLSSDVPRSIRS